VACAQGAVNDQIERIFKIDVYLLLIHICIIIFVPLIHFD